MSQATKKCKKNEDFFLKSIADSSQKSIKMPALNAGVIDEEPHTLYLNFGKKK